MPSYNIRVNGFARTVNSSDPGQPLLYVLRGFGLKAAKFGCGLGQCGACTVLIDGKAARSCTTTIADVQGKSITTLEGLGSSSTPHPHPGRFHQRASAAMRLLHQRHDHERGRACWSRSQSRRKRKSARRSTAIFAAAARMCGSCAP